MRDAAQSQPADATLLSLAAIIQSLSARIGLLSLLRSQTIGIGQQAQNIPHHPTPPHPIRSRCLGRQVPLSKRQPCLTHYHQMKGSFVNSNRYIPAQTFSLDCRLLTPFPTPYSTPFRMHFRPRNRHGISNNTRNLRCERTGWAKNLLTLQTGIMWVTPRPYLRKSMLKC